MSSFKPSKLDKSATIKACNQLSKICEVIITRLSKADIEKYTRDNKVSAVTVTSRCSERGQTRGRDSDDDNRVKIHPRGRPTKSGSNDDDFQVKKCFRSPGRPKKYDIPPNRKYNASSNDVLSERNSEDPVVEFVDCSLNVEELNASTGFLNLQTLIEDKVSSLLKESHLNDTNSESRCDKADTKKKRKSVRFAEDNKTSKRVKLDKNRESCNNNNNNEILDNSKVRIIIDEKSLENSCERVRTTKDTVFVSQQDCLAMHSVKQHSSTSTSMSTEDQSFTLPRPIKCENTENITDCGGDSNSIIYDIPNTASLDCNSIKREEERQLDFSLTGHEDFTEVCVSVSNGNIYNEKFSEQFTSDIDIPSMNDIPHGTRNNRPVVLELRDPLQIVETVTTPQGSSDSYKQKVVSKDTNISPVIQVGSKVETQHANSVVSSSTNGETVIPSQKRETNVDLRSYFNKTSSMPLKSEEIKKPAFSVIDDCITIEDDDDDIIELSDTEEIVNCGNNEDEVMPVVNCDENKNEGKLSAACLEMDENTRCSLDSNASEELMDLTTESGNIIVFDGVNSIRVCSDEEELTAKATCVKENALLPSVSGIPCSVIVTDKIPGWRNRKGVTSHHDATTSDDVNTVELNSTGDCMLRVENCATADSLFENLLNRNEFTYGKSIATRSTSSNRNSHVLNSNMSVGTSNTDKEHSSKDKHVPRIRVKDPVNLGIMSSEQCSGNSAKAVSDKTVTSKHGAKTESVETEKSDLLASMRKAIWSQSSFTEEEKSILRMYKKYFDDSTEEIVKKLGQIIHLAVCDKLNYVKYNEQVKKLVTGSTVVTEKTKAESVHNVDIWMHGTNFMKLLNEFVNKINVHDSNDMLFMILCRALDSFLRIDAGNRKYYRTARDVLQEILSKVDCGNYSKLNLIIKMDAYQFLDKYNTTIKLISRYCDFISDLRYPFKSKLVEGGGATSNEQIKQSTVSDFINLKNTMLQEQQVSFNTMKDFSASSVQLDTAVSVSKSKQPLIKGVLLLNGENMTNVSPISISKILQLNKQLNISQKQKYFLECYQVYFLGKTEDELLKLGELLHVITSEMLCQNRKLESISSLPQSSLKVYEEKKILTAYRNNLKERGFNFIEVMKGVMSKFHGQYFARMVCTMYFRITEIFLKIDINNIKYFVIVREVVKKMLELNEFDSKPLFELLTMKEEDFVRSYNSVIHILLVYYELLKLGKSQSTGNVTNNSSGGSQQSTTMSRETSEGNIMIPLTTRVVEVPILRRISKNSILIV